MAKKVQFTSDESPWSLAHQALHTQSMQVTQALQDLIEFPIDDKDYRAPFLNIALDSDDESDEDKLNELLVSIDLKGRSFNQDSTYNRLLSNVKLYQEKAAELEQIKPTLLTRILSFFGFKSERDKKIESLNTIRNVFPEVLKNFHNEHLYQPLDKVFAQYKAMVPEQEDRNNDLFNRYESHVRQYQLDNKHVTIMMKALEHARLLSQQSISDVPLSFLDRILIGIGFKAPPSLVVLQDKDKAESIKESIQETLKQMKVGLENFKHLKPQLIRQKDALFQEKEAEINRIFFNQSSRRHLLNFVSQAQSMFSDFRDEAFTKLHQEENIKALKMLYVWRTQAREYFSRENVSKYSIHIHAGEVEASLNYLITQVEPYVYPDVVKQIHTYEHEFTKQYPQLYDKYHEKISDSVFNLHEIFSLLVFMDDKSPNLDMIFKKNGMSISEIEMSRVDRAAIGIISKQNSFKNFLTLIDKHGPEAFNQLCADMFVFLDSKDFSNKNILKSAKLANITTAFGRYDFVSQAREAINAINAFTEAAFQKRLDTFSHSQQSIQTTFDRFIQSVAELGKQETLTDAEKTKATTAMKRAFVEELGGVLQHAEQILKNQMKLPEKNVNDFILKIEQLFEVVKDVKKPSEINQDELYDQFEQHIKDLMYYGIDDISTDLDKSLPNDNGYQMISESERQVFRAGCIKTFDDALRKMGALLSIDGSLSELHKVSQQAVSALKCNPKVAALCPSYTTLSKQQISKLKKPFKQVSPPEEQANIQQLFDQKFGIFYLANEENYLNDIFTMMENEFYHIDMFEIPACVSQSEESLDLDSIPTSEILNQYKDFDEAMRAFKFKKTIQNYCNLLSIYKKHQDRPDIASSEDIKKIMEGYKGIFNATYKDLLAKYAPSSNRGLCPMIRFSEGKSFQALQSELLPKLEEAQKGDLFKTKSSNANYLLDALTDFMTNPVYDNYIKLREEMLAFPEYKQDDDLNDVIKQLADVCLIVSKLNRGIQYLVVDKKATVDPKLQTIFDEYLTKYSDEDDESISPTHFATIRFELGEYLKNRNIDTFTTLAHAMLDKRSYVDEVPLRNLIYELMAYDKPLQDIQIVVEDLNRKEASERLVLEFLKNNEDFGHQYGETLAALQAYLQDRNEKNYMTLAHSVYENNILNVHAPFYGLILNLGEIDRNIHDFPQLIQKLNGQDLLDYISEHPVDPEIEDFFNQAKVFLVTPTSKVRAKLEQVYQAQLGLDLAPEHLSHIQEMMDSINHIYPELEKSASSTSSSVNSTQDGYTTGEETPSLTSSSSEYSSGDEASFKGKLDKIKSGPNGNESNDEAYPDYTRPTRR